MLEISLMSVVGLSRAIRSVCILWLVLILLVFPLAAQDATKPFQDGNLSVIVTDTSGAVIPNAEVAFKGEQRLTTRTGQDGSAHVTLPYGGYAVTVNVRGFETAEIKDLLIRVPDPPDLNVVLQVAPSPCNPCSEIPMTVQTVTSELPTVIADDHASVPIAYAATTKRRSVRCLYLWKCSTAQR